MWLRCSFPQISPVSSHHTWNRPNIFPKVNKSLRNLLPILVHPFQFLILSPPTCCVRHQDSCSLGLCFSGTLSETSCLSILSKEFHDIFFPGLLRYYGQICNFKVYNAMIWFSIVIFYLQPAFSFYFMQLHILCYYFVFVCSLEYKSLRV